MVGEGTNWEKLEREVADHDIFEGYKIQEQKYSTSTGKRPDIFAIHKDNPHDRIVADAKCVQELTKSHVNQVKGYKGYPFFAPIGFLFVAKDTYVSHEVRAYARDNNVFIKRTNVSQQRGFIDIISDFFS